MKFSIKCFFQFPVNFVTFTEEILNGTLHFCEVFIRFVKYFLEVHMTKDCVK